MNNFIQQGCSKLLKKKVIVKTFILFQFLFQINAVTLTS